MPTRPAAAPSGPGPWGASVNDDPVETYKRALIARLSERLESARISVRVSNAADLSQVDMDVDRMLAALPAANVWDQVLGSFYDTAGVAKWKGITRQGVGKQVSKRVILAVKTGNGALLYPAFQFGPAGEPLPHLAEVLTVLDPDRRDLWGDAVWLNTPAPEFGDRTAAELLHAGDATAVIEVAARDVARWAS